MPANVGSQVLSLKYGASGSSAEINRRFVGIRPVGIYSGGYLSVTDGTHASISPLVCEIGDGTHQVRIATTVAVNVVVSSVVPYIVLRWSYTGDTSDYMELLAVGSGSLQDNDIIVGKCTFTGGGLLNGFIYTERTVPNTFDDFLKVEPTTSSELRVRIRAGRIHTNEANIDIADQLSSLFVPPVSNSRIDLVYVNSLGAIAIDSSGTASASPVAPDYGDKIVLAEVTLASTSTDITSSMIKDVRNFITAPCVPDDVTIEKDSSGKLTIKSIPGFSAGASRSENTVYTAATAGILVVRSTITWVYNTDTYVTVYSDTFVDPVTEVGISGGKCIRGDSSQNISYFTMSIPILKDNKYKVVPTASGAVIRGINFYPV